ncbi:hypothetical protein HYX02_08360, partial [Candidatus Woesearchaeota archaeon]|nr:hypothetical protein [Candidatus Woesearchaeota archaeon]
TEVPTPTGPEIVSPVPTPTERRAEEPGGLAIPPWLWFLLLPLLAGLAYLGGKKLWEKRKARKKKEERLEELTVEKIIDEIFKIAKKKLEILEKIKEILGRKKALTDLQRDLYYKALKYDKAYWIDPESEAHQQFAKQDKAIKELLELELQVEKLLKELLEIEINLTGYKKKNPFKNSVALNWIYTLMDFDKKKSKEIEQEIERLQKLSPLLWREKFWEFVKNFVGAKPDLPDWYTSRFGEVIRLIDELVMTYQWDPNTLTLIKKSIALNLDGTIKRDARGRIIWISGQATPTGVAYERWELNPADISAMEGTWFTGSPSICELMIKYIGFYFLIARDEAYKQKAWKKIISPKQLEKYIKKKDKWKVIEKLWEGRPEHEAPDIIKRHFTEEEELFNTRFMPVLYRELKHMFKLIKLLKYLVSKREETLMQPLRVEYIQPTAPYGPGPYRAPPYGAPYSAPYGAPYGVPPTGGGTKAEYSASQIQGPKSVEYIDPITGTKTKTQSPQFVIPVIPRENFIRVYTILATGEGPFNLVCFLDKKTVIGVKKDIQKTEAHPVFEFKSEEFSDKLTDGEHEISFYLIGPKPKTEEGKEPLATPISQKYRDVKSIKIRIGPPTAPYGPGPYGAPYAPSAVGGASQTLINNPNAVLNHYDEIEAYLNRLPAPYLQQVRILANQIKRVMDNTVRLVICIPVAGHQEGAYIYESLKNYTYQTADPSTYEIVLFVNHPDRDPSGTVIMPDTTISEINRFRSDYPNIPLRVMYQVIPRDQAKIGFIRKLLTDAVLFRHHKRGRNVPDLILVSNDADNKGVAPEYIENFIRKFDANTKIDALVGQIDWDTESYIQYPLIYIGARIFQYIEVRLRSDKIFITSGNNWAYRSSIYAAIGGYNSALQLGEDTSLGHAIINARKSRDVIAYAGSRVSRIYVSARRSIYALQKGVPHIGQWDMGWSVFDDEVRKFTLKQEPNVNYDDPQTIENLRNGVEWVVNASFKFRAWQLSYWTSNNEEQAYKECTKALSWIGIQFVFEDGKFKVTNMDRLIRKLKDLQSRGLWIRDLKSGKVRGRPGAPPPPPGQYPSITITEPADDPLGNKPINETEDIKIKAQINNWDLAASGLNPILQLVEKVNNIEKVIREFGSISQNSFEVVVNASEIGLGMHKIFLRLVDVFAGDPKPHLDSSTISIKIRSIDEQRMQQDWANIKNEYDRDKDFVKFLSRIYQAKLITGKNSEINLLQEILVIILKVFSETPALRRTGVSREGDIKRLLNSIFHPDVTERGESPIKELYEDIIKLFNSYLSYNGRVEDEYIDDAINTIKLIEQIIQELQQFSSKYRFDIGETERLLDNINAHLKGALAHYVREKERQVA